MDADGLKRSWSLVAQYGDQVADLEVRRASLEDTYMAIAHRHERAQLEEVSAR